MSRCAGYITRPTSRFWNSASNKPKSYTLLGPASVSACPESCATPRTVPGESVLHLISSANILYMMASLRVPSGCETHQQVIWQDIAIVQEVRAPSLCCLFQEAQQPVSARVNQTGGCLEIRTRGTLARNPAIPFAVVDLSLIDFVPVQQMIEPQREEHRLRGGRAQEEQDFPRFLEGDTLTQGDASRRCSSPLLRRGASKHSSLPRNRTSRRHAAHLAAPR